LIATLPMYDWPELRSETDRIWETIATHFKRAGFDAPNNLSKPESEWDYWRSSDLLFSQTCGYPYSTELVEQVELLGTPTFDIPGWSGTDYSSALVVRSDFDATNLEQCRSGTFAFNGRNSLSGYRCLSPLIGPPEDWFAASVQSGGHRESARMVSRGEADIAAIDAQCWNLFGKFEPEAADRLIVLQWTPGLPGLPYITNNQWPSEQLANLRAALGDAVEQISAENAAPYLGLAAVTVLNESAYQSIKLL